MGLPTTGDEFMARFRANFNITGYGLDVTTHAPCPFCAAPDFQLWNVLTCEADMQCEAQCRECGRSSKTIVTRTDSGIETEIVQTGGFPAPAYLIPAPRYTA